ncbi:hypothetical protein C8F04DRAFT_1320207 [Mycena alexandri]|uniref:YEATS domain-containing protein n=1 Tax=Mycena alexandri TaxID=1745969 RepID=A0AAD6T3M9_9AGAR|nr:hypothetical protein C8F04DRAFT_1320207 [Mycena alexandri]
MSNLEQLSLDQLQLDPKSSDPVESISPPTTIAATEPDQTPPCGAWNTCPMRFAGEASRDRPAVAAACRARVHDVDARVARGAGDASRGSRDTWDWVGRFKTLSRIRSPSKPAVSKPKEPDPPIKLEFPSVHKKPLISHPISTSKPEPPRLNLHMPAGRPRLRTCSIGNNTVVFDAGPRARSRTATLMRTPHSRPATPVHAHALSQQQHSPVARTPNQRQTPNRAARADAPCAPVSPSKSSSLGYHANTPALVGVLGREPIRRGVVVWDPDAVVDINGFGEDEKPRTKPRWWMPFSHRNTFVEKQVPIQVPAPPEISAPLPQSNMNVLPTASSRFHIATCVIVVDRSLWLSPDQRFGNNMHKWMIAVDAPHITSPLSSTASPSSPRRGPLSPPAPPFAVIGTAEAPLLARIKLAFNSAHIGGDHQKIVLEHWVELDRKHNPSVVYGEERVVDIELDRGTMFLPSCSGYVSINTGVGGAERLGVPNARHKVSILNIDIIGNKADVDGVVRQVSELIGKLIGATQEVSVDWLVHCFITGKKAKKLKQFHEAHNIQVFFPPESAEQSTVLPVYDPLSANASPSPDEKRHLEEVAKEILKLAKEAADVKSETIAVEKRWYDAVVGKGGITLNAIIGEDKTLSIKVGGDASDPLGEDVIVIRGVSGDVDRAVKEVLKIVEDAKNNEIVNSYSTEFDVEREFVGRIIGAQGADVNKLRDQLGVRVDVSDKVDEKEKEAGGKKKKLAIHQKSKVKITGRKENVEEAKKRILAQIKRLADEISEVLKSPSQYHSSLIGQSGKYAIRLEDKYSVKITFPRQSAENGEGKTREVLKSDEVLVKGGKKGQGGKKGVAGAKSELLEAVEFNFYATLSYKMFVESSYFRNMIVCGV